MMIGREEMNKSTWVSILLYVKSWSRVKKKTSYYYNLCQKLHIAFFTSWLISNTFIILLNNEIWKLAKNLKGDKYIYYILYVMFSREARMILVILKRNTVMLFREVLWFFPFMNDLLYDELCSKKDLKSRCNII